LFISIRTFLFSFTERHIMFEEQGPKLYVIIIKLLNISNEHFVI